MAIRQHFMNLNLEVRNDNFSAINIYKKLGFTEEGVITRFIQINGIFYDGLFMGYTIDSFYLKTHFSFVASQLYFITYQF